MPIPEAPVSQFQAPSADASALSEIDQLFASLDGQGAQSVILRLSRPTAAGDIIRALEAVGVDADSPSVVRI